MIPDDQPDAPDLDPDTTVVQEVLRTHDGVEYLDYHDPETYDAFPDDQPMALAVAVDGGGHPCPACFPDTSYAEQYEVTQRGERTEIRLRNAPEENPE